MAHIPLFDELAVIAAIGVIVSVLLARLRFPTTAGLLLTGALLGPSGFRVVGDVENLLGLAEIGVVLLLFTIGLEFSLERLRRIAKLVAVGGSLQVGLTTAAVATVAVLLDRTMGQAIFYGFVVALSSTAIVLRALADRGEIDAPHGRFVVGALIFQDLCVVPMVLIVPLLGGGAEQATLAVALALGKAAVVVVAVVVTARVAVPRMLDWVDVSRSREVFVLAILGICIGTAWLTSLAGLSLALGAFLGGIVVADTEYKHRALGEILPMRDVFTSIFFVSLGMLFDFRAVLADPGTALFLLAAFTVMKGLIATISALAMRFPARVAWLSGVGLAQFGEFGFVLASVATASGLLPRSELDVLLAAGIASMFLTPILVGLAPRITAGELLLRPLERLLGVQGIDEPSPEHCEIETHVVLVGLGISGRLLARVLTERNLPFIALEINADTVRRLRAEGHPIYYGDASSVEALHHASVETARAVVLLINDPEAVRRAIVAIRHVSPDVPIFVRARYLTDRDALLALGATDVVVEEVEAGIEMIAKLLRAFDVARNEIEEHVGAAREKTLESARPLKLPRKRISDLDELADLKIEKLRLRSGDPACGQSPRQLSLRARTGALVVAVRRQGRLVDDPSADAPFETDDVIYLVGGGRAIGEAIALLTARQDEGSSEAGNEPRELA